MELKQETLYTIEDIYNLSGDKRAELIDGNLYFMSAPSRIHQKLIMDLSAVIYNYIRGKNGECEVYPAPFAVLLNGDDKLYVEPDISVICNKNKLTDKGCNGAPDWIIEIVSPSSKYMDYFRKLVKYEAAGVREYWIVDPMKDTVIVYDFVNETKEDYKFTDCVKVNIYKDLNIDFSSFIYNN